MNDYQPLHLQKLSLTYLEKRNTGHLVHSTLVWVFDTWMYNLTLSFEETMGKWGLANTPNKNIEVFAYILKHFATSWNQGQQCWTDE